MSGDHQLRAVERRLAGGDPDLEAELWALRLRRGEVQEDQLALAAYVGHQPSHTALGARAPQASGSFETWVAGLRRWGAGTWVRAALAGARPAVALWATHHPQDPRPDEALVAAKAWLRERSPRLAQAAHAAADACYAILGELEPSSTQDLRRPWPERWATAFRETRAAGLAALAAAHVGDMSLGYAKLSLVAARERLALAEVPAGPGGRALFERAAQVDRLGHLPELHTDASAARVREAVARALLASALGAAADSGPS